MKENNASITLKRHKISRLFAYGSSATITIILTQVIQKIYPILDNHFIAHLGNQELLIHNIYYIFQSIAQYTSYAAATTCLILWKKDDNETDHKNIFSIFFIYSILSSLICIIPIYVCLPNIIKHFGVQLDYDAIAEKYLIWGLGSVIVLTVFNYMSNLNNGTKKYTLTLFFSCIVFVLLFTINYVGTKGQIHDKNSMIYIISTKTILLLFICSILFYCSSYKISIRKIFSLDSSVYRIWISELASGIISALYPIIFAFQLALVGGETSLIVSYQMILQLTSFFCLPLMCSIQVNLVQASACNGIIKNQVWWSNLLVSGLTPTIILLVICLFFNKNLIEYIYNFNLPREHEIYIRLFIISTIIGQLGNVFTTILRARKKSHKVTLIYYVTDIIFLLGLTQLFILSKIQSPLTIGIATLIYTIAYTFFALYFCQKGRLKHG